LLPSLLGRFDRIAVEIELRLVANGLWELGPYGLAAGFQDRTIHAARKVGSVNGCLRTIAAFRFMRQGIAARGFAIIRVWVVMFPWLHW
jgi:hypothetical protein